MTEHTLILDGVTVDLEIAVRSSLESGIQWLSMTTTDHSVFSAEEQGDAIARMFRAIYDKSIVSEDHWADAGYLILKDFEGDEIRLIKSIPVTISYRTAEYAVASEEEDRVVEQLSRDKL